MSQSDGAPRPAGRGKRGPKPRTGANSRATIRIPRAIEPTAELGKAELAEFVRLEEVLRRRGVIEKIDPGAVTDLARLKVALDAAYKAKPFSPRAVGVLQGHIRGIRRELGLSLQSSRVVTRTSPDEPGSARAYWKSKLGGE